MKQFVLLGILSLPILAQNTLDLTAPIPPPVNSGSGTVVVAAPLGVGQSQTLYYWIVVNYPMGNSFPYGPIRADLAPLTLDGANYVRLNWNAVPGASTYDVLRTATEVLPNGSCTCAVTTSLSAITVNDTGGALGPYTFSNIRPASAKFILNNRDYPTPRVLLDTMLAIASNLNLSPTVTSKTGTSGTAVCSQSMQGVLKIGTCYLNGYANTGAAQTYTYPTAFSTTPVLQISGGSCGAHDPTTSATVLTLPANAAMVAETCNVVVIGQ